MAAVEFSADARLNAVRFASKTIVSSVVTQCLLWVCQWQADARHKCRLDSAPFIGDRLLGDSLDPILTKSRDKHKILPSLSWRPDSRPPPYFHRSSFWGPDTGFGFSHLQQQYFPGQEQHQDRSGRNKQQFPPKKYFQGGGGRFFWR